MNATDIVAYTYSAENFTPAGVIEALITDGKASPAARDMDVETVLTQIAEANGIDRFDERSYDSSEFPKVIFASDWGWDEDEALDELGHTVTLDDAPADWQLDCEHDGPTETNSEGQVRCLVCGHLALA